MTGCLKDCLAEAVDCALEVRQDLCAQIEDSYIVVRTWTGERVGDGSFSDVQQAIKPFPQIVDLSHDVRVQMNGSYKSGDLILKSISQKNLTEEDLRTDTGVRNIEKFIKVGPHYYRTIHIKKKIATWDIHIRKVAQDETERR